MRLKIIFFLLIFKFVIFQNIQAQTGEKLHSKYQIRTIKKIDSIFAITPNVLKADSIYYQDVKRKQDSLKGFRPSENYSLIKLHLYYNNNLSDDSFLLPGFTCFANLAGDTSIVITGYYLGMGMLTIKQQMGFEIKINRKDFVTSYFDDWELSEKYYKTITDKPQNFIDIGAKRQTLTLVQQPNFKVGELLKGHVTFFSNDYFQKGYDGFVKTNVACDIYFQTRIIEKDVFEGRRGWQHMVYKIPFNHDDSFHVQKMNFNYIPNINSFETIWKCDENGIDLFDVFRNKIVDEVPVPVEKKDQYVTVKGLYVFEGNKFYYLFPLYRQFNKPNCVIIYNKKTKNQILLDNSRFQNVSSIKFNAVNLYSSIDELFKKKKPEFQIDSLNSIRLDLVNDTFIYEKKKEEHESYYRNPFTTNDFKVQLDSFTKRILILRRNKIIVRQLEYAYTFYADREILIYSNRGKNKFYVIDSVGTFTDSIQLQNIQFANQFHVEVDRNKSEIIFRMRYEIPNPDPNNSESFQRNDFLLYNLKTKKIKIANYQKLKPYEK